MKIVKDIQSCRETISNIPAGNTIGFVPTMGALHKGHLSLVDASKEKSDVTVMSIFVNPTQFGPNEDFEAYPRVLDDDIAKAKASGVDILFVPGSTEMYGTDASTTVKETQISRGLCGAFRPGHFQGVCTVVLKLLNIVSPQYLFLGQKDGQQLRVLEKMASDVNLPVQVIGCPTLREKDGLALSSRNKYLVPEEREVAPKIYQSLRAAAEALSSGELKTENLIHKATSYLKQEPAIQLQYLEIRRWSDFEEVEVIEEKCIMAVAAFIGKTRLIDNIILFPPQP